MGTQTTVFIVTDEGQMPALWFIEHERGVDAKRMLKVAAHDFINQHPDLEFLRSTDVFDLPEAFLATYGLKPSAQRFLVEDWDEDGFEPDETEA
jgi:hypothetical protein